MLGIVDALCPSVGQRDKEGSIRKQKQREGWNCVGGHLFPLRLILHQRILRKKVKRPEEFQKIVENKGRSHAGEKKKLKKEYGQQKASYVERRPKK